MAFLHAVLRAARTFARSPSNPVTSPTVGDNRKKDTHRSVLFSMVEVTGFEAEKVRFTMCHRVAQDQVSSRSCCRDITRYFTK